MPPEILIPFDDAGALALLLEIVVPLAWLLAARVRVLCAAPAGATEQPVAPAAIDHLAAAGLAPGVEIVAPAALRHAVHEQAMLALLPGRRGPVAAALARRAAGPVLLCPDAGCAHGQWPPRRILAALNGEPTDDWTIEQAAQLAEQVHGALILSRRYDAAREVLALSDGLGGLTAWQLQAVAAEAAYATLDARTAALRQRPLRVQRDDLRLPPASWAVHTAVRAHRADLVVVAQAAHTRLGRWWNQLGLRQLLAGAGVPLLVIAQPPG